MSNPTATDVLGPVAVALYQRLAGDAPLVAFLGVDAGRGLDGVYDLVAPEAAPTPYVVLGDGVETPRNVHGGYGAEVIVDLHVWDRSQSTSTVSSIANRLRGLLDHQPLTVSGHTVVAVRHDQTLTLRDPDPELRHLMVRIRITTEQE